MKPSKTDQKDIDNIFIKGKALCSKIQSKIKCKPCSETTIIVDELGEFVKTCTDLATDLATAKAYAISRAVDHAEITEATELKLSAKVFEASRTFAS